MQHFISWRGIAAITLLAIFGSSAHAEGRRFRRHRAALARLTKAKHAARVFAPETMATPDATLNRLSRRVARYATLQSRLKATLTPEGRIEREIAHLSGHPQFASYKAYRYRILELSRKLERAKEKANQPMWRPSDVRAARDKVARAAAELNKATQHADGWRRFFEQQTDKPNQLAARLRREDAAATRRIADIGVKLEQLAHAVDKQLETQISAKGLNLSLAKFKRAARVKAPYPEARFQRVIQMPRDYSGQLLFQIGTHLTAATPVRGLARLNPSAALNRFVWRSEAKHSLNTVFSLIRAAEKTTDTKQLLKREAAFNALAEHYRGYERARAGELPGTAP